MPVASDLVARANAVVEVPDLAALGSLDRMIGGWAREATRPALEALSASAGLRPLLDAWQAPLLAAATLAPPDTWSGPVPLHVARRRRFRQIRGGRGDA